MDLSITPGLYPSNTGWNFPDPVTGCMIRGKNFLDLVAGLTIYRQINHLDPGDPEGEVKLYVCTKNPMLCRTGDGQKFGGSAEHRVEPISLEAPVLERALDWARRQTMPRRPSQTPSQEELNRRTDACRACTLNRSAPGCFSCRVEGRLLVAKLSSALNAAQKRKLKICHHYAWHNAAAAAVGDIPSDAGAPAGCWRTPASVS